VRGCARCSARGRLGSGSGRRSGTRRREAVRAATVDAGPTWAARRAAKLKRRAGPRGKKNWAARRAWARSVK
jgi:hypothetical protein